MGLYFSNNWTTSEYRIWTDWYATLRSYILKFCTVWHTSITLCRTSVWPRKLKKFWKEVLMTICDWNIFQNECQIIGSEVSGEIRRDVVAEFHFICLRKSCRDRKKTGYSGSLNWCWHFEKKWEPSKIVYENWKFTLGNQKNVDLCFHYFFLWKWTCVFCSYVTKNIAIFRERVSFIEICVPVHCYMKSVSQQDRTNHASA